MKRLQGKKILLTGASRGIGEALARQLAQQGAHLILVARNVEQLESLAVELKKITSACDYIPCDLSKADQVEQLIQKIKTDYSKLDGIIHNAGVGLYAEFEITHEKDARELFEINFFSILKLTQGLLPLLKLGEDPTLLFVSSVIGWRAIPRIAVYCASKAALNLFSESLRIELEKYSIKVITAYPGRTKTEFSNQAKSIGWRPSATKYGMTAEKVAHKLIQAYRKGKREEFVSFGNRVMIWTNFLFPKLLDRGLRKYFRNK